MKELAGGQLSLHVSSRGFVPLFHQLLALRK
jgi:hypothetical protein